MFFFLSSLFELFTTWLKYGLNFLRAPFKFKRVEISIIIKKYEYFDEKSKESIFAQLIILNERRKSRKLFELFSIETKIILHQFRTFSCESARAPWAPPSSENKRWLTCFTKCLWFNIYYNSMAFKANVCLILREWEKTERKLCVSTAAALTLERIWFNNVICLTRCRHSALLHIIFYFFLKSYPSVSFGTLMLLPIIWLVPREILLFHNCLSPPVPKPSSSTFYLSLLLCYFSIIRLSLPPLDMRDRSSLSSVSECCWTSFSSLKHRPNRLEPATHFTWSKKLSSSIAPESCGSRSSSLISNDHKNIIKFRVVNEKKTVFSLFSLSSLDRLESDK